MIEFFLNVIIVSGGVLCIIAWLALIIEVIDRLADSRKPTTLED